MPLLVPGVDRSITDPRNPLPQTTSTRMPQLKALTSVRAFAALYVGLYHMVQPRVQWGALNTFMSAGYISVSFFFVLSGFILTYTHGLEYAAGKGDKKQFWVARFARVYPIYFAITLWSGYIGRAAFHQRAHIFAFVADLLMLQAWSIRMVSFFNVAAWSLSVEAFFYLLFPFIVLRLRPRSLKTGLLVFAGCYAACLAIASVGVIVDPIPGWDDRLAGAAGAHHFLFALRRYPFLQLPEFACGIALGWIYLQSNVSRRFGQVALWTGLIGLMIALALSEHLPFELLHNGLLLPLFALLVIGMTQRNIVSTALGAAPFLLLGEASYSFYLLHFNFSEICASEFGWKMDIPGLLPRMLILVPLCICLHLWVERPARRMVLRWWAARKARVLTAA
jgi:peptidoglycan/LPS O-acetylase OafA/YrhL